MGVKLVRHIEWGI